MSAVEKLFALSGMDLGASVKAAGDGIANLNLHLQRGTENMAAIALRLDAIDARQSEMLAALAQIVARLAPHTGEPPT
jgi:hypothetical protein